MVTLGYTTFEMLELGAALSLLAKHSDSNGVSQLHTVTCLHIIIAAFLVACMRMHVVAESVLGSMITHMSASRSSKYIQQAGSSHHWSQ